MNLQLEKDAQHYVQLWDESKKNYMDYKEETQAIVVLQKRRAAESAQAAVKRRHSSCMKRSGINARQLRRRAAWRKSFVKEIEDKCRELENSFFDLQMENLQLKEGTWENRRTSTDSSCNERQNAYDVLEYNKIIEMLRGAGRF